ncbi:MAG: Glycosyl transferase family 1 [uncultured Sulfurovum sp.]|uniref:Glycosyl transferase family 1 n=1 Tax=uncultured Sulfurovum sp. TaxID=269237 RepID=A0A6S6SP10_9BACT|nr:MAG: Glycosyl transferase family 1 [uncultured Sulfurovum sp.]
MIKVANVVFNGFTNDSRVLKESISLSKNGYQVEVIAHGDKGLIDDEEVENFRVRRFSYLDRTTTLGKFQKLKAYMNYMKESIHYCKNFDILHCNDLITLPIGFVIKKFYNNNIKIVYDAHEYETEMNGLSQTSKKISKVLEKFLIKYVDTMITVSAGIADEYVKLYNIEKPSLILNTPPHKNVIKKDIFREVFDITTEQRIFLYQGSLSKGRGIEILVETFKSLDSSTVIVFMGYGQLANFLKLSAHENENIYFHDAMKPDVLLDYTSSADFGISTIEDTCLSYHYCLPNKMFEYIMAEVPVIVSNLPEMKRIVLDNAVGLVVDENSVEGLKKAIIESTHLNKNELNQNLKSLKKIYNWEEQEKVLLRIYKELEG